MMNKYISLYVHIPFCVRKCNYCDFLSFPTLLENQKLYIMALKKEIISYKDKLKDYEISTIFIGGGTPSILDEFLISDLFNTIKNSFNISKNAEITIECNPKTITKEKLLVYKTLGINRLSIGLQSTNDKELKLLGRIYKYSDFLENFQMIREIGFSNINIDLMSALPTQTLKSYEDTLLKVVKLNPEHISAYSLIIEENTPFFDDEYILKSLPSEKMDRQMYSLTKDILRDYGYLRYEISNYSKKGFECKHNIVYWKAKEYIGVGLGASSYFKNKRFNNISNMNEYLKLNISNINIIENIEEIDEEAQIEEFMFLGLRMIEGISIQEFYQKFHKSIFEVYGDILEKFKSKNLIIQNQDRIYLSDNGIDISNSIFCEFLLS